LGLSDTDWLWDTDEESEVRKRKRKDKRDKSAERVGAHTIYGDIYVGKGGGIVVNEEDDFTRSSKIIINGGRLEMWASSHSSNKVIRINEIHIVGENSILIFYYSHVLYIEDFIIDAGADLCIENWSRVQGFFVKKTSTHLADALTKMRIDNSSGPVGVRSYNDYWEIGVGEGFRPITEPTTYGAAFSLFGLGFVAWWRRVRRARRAPTLDKRR